MENQYVARAMRVRSNARRGNAKRHPEMQNDTRNYEISTDQRVLVPTQLPRTEFDKLEVTISHVKMAAETPNLGCRSIFGPETCDEAKKNELTATYFGPAGPGGSKNYFC